MFIWYRYIWYMYVLYILALDSGSDSLNEINNTRFVIEASALKDVYEEISKMSLGVQTPDLYQWQANAVVDNSVSNLNLISQHLTVEIEATNRMALTQKLLEIVDEGKVPLLKSSAETASEILQSGTYRSKPLFPNQQLGASRGTRNYTHQAQVDFVTEHEEAIKAGLKNVGKYAAALGANIKKRMEVNQYEVLREAGEESRALKKLLEIALTLFQFHSLLLL